MMSSLTVFLLLKQQNRPRQHGIYLLITEMILSIPCSDFPFIFGILRNLWNIFRLI